MESRVMGNCHARFGAGENPEERICSLRLHIPPKGLPIAIQNAGTGASGRRDRVHHVQRHNGQGFP